MPRGFGTYRALKYMIMKEKTPCFRRIAPLLQGKYYEEKISCLITYYGKIIDKKIYAVMKNLLIFCECGKAMDIIFDASKYIIQL